MCIRDRVKDSDYQGLVDETKIVEMTDEIGWIKTSVQPVEKPACIQDLWMAKGGLVYSRKPLHTSPFGKLGSSGLIEMAAEVMGLSLIHIYMRGQIIIEVIPYGY